MEAKTITVAICSATGAIYARWLLRHLSSCNAGIALVISPRAKDLIRSELKIDSLRPDAIAGSPIEGIKVYEYDDLAAPISSGSAAADGMIICPCSSNTLAAIAAGLSENLIHRGAYVSLKQRRPLVLVHRESPLTSIDIENMSRVTIAGGIIFPASPVFYTRPESIDDLASNHAIRVIELAGVKVDNPNRWHGGRQGRS
jgi:polyprenyl P-hydroxybenzoate/phenylacrylic acid decarboxylase-like protein